MWLISEIKYVAIDVAHTNHIRSSIYLKMTFRSDDKSQVSNIYNIALAPKNIFKAQLLKYAIK